MSGQSVQPAEEKIVRLDGGVTDVEVNSTRLGESEGEGPAGRHALVIVRTGTTVAPLPCIFAPPPRSRGVRVGKDDICKDTFASQRR